MSAEQILLIIGKNIPKFHENQNERELVNIPKNIQHTYFGFDIAIFANADHSELYVTNLNKSLLGIHDSSYSEYSLTRVEYFNNNHIKIKKIFLNGASDSVFCMSFDDKIYGIGKNESGQLGLGHNNTPNKPELISSLTNVIDIQSTEYYSLAICASDNHTTNIILSYWSRIHNLHNDIITLLYLFCKIHRVYSTGLEDNCGNGHTKQESIKSKYGWNEIETLNDKDIIQVSVGNNHSLFLESNGNIWSCGKNLDGELGLDKNVDSAPQPIIIPFFAENKIKIKSISSGCGQNLALASNGTVYSFGENSVGMCGTGTTEPVYLPQAIDFGKDVIIDEIKCGIEHSYCKSINGEYYLFGGNENFECLQFDDKQTQILSPISINQVIKERYNKGRILGLNLGFEITTIAIG